MNETRKKVILNEILYWKQTRILPEKYCDYLLALYSEGEFKSHSATEPPKKKIRYFLPEILISLILMTALIVNYFTEIPGAMQMSLFTFFICLLLGITYYQVRKQASILYPLIAAAIPLLLLSVRAWELFFSAQILMLYVILFSNCLIWILAGRKTGYLYFTVAGWLGTAVILYFIGSFFGFL